MRWDWPRIVTVCLLGLALGCVPASSGPGTPTTTPTPAPVTAPAPSAEHEDYPPQLPPLTAPHYSYRVVERYPHDPTAFTQGLLMGPQEGTFYESTGLKAHSELRLVELKTGKVLRRQKLEDQYFGEGLALAGGHLHWLTWQSHCGFTFDPANFKRLGTFGYLNEGWGLTTDPQGQLVMSDGTSKLSWHDPQGFKETGAQVVKDGPNPIQGLNELEWMEGQVLANVWTTPYIAMINPKDGAVQGWLDMRGLLSDQEAAHADVLNGIAYDARKKKLFVTGKLWPRLFEIEIVKGP